MKRTGTIAAINAGRGMVAIATQDDGYTIIELLSDWDVEVGDEIAWANGYGLGSEIYQNVTKRSQQQVYFQNHSVHQTAVRQQLMA
jgi:hypothetical protein